MVEEKERKLGWRVSRGLRGMSFRGGVKKGWMNEVQRRGGVIERSECRKAREGGKGKNAVRLSSRVTTLWAPGVR